MLAPKSEKKAAKVASQLRSGLWSTVGLPVPWIFGVFVMAKAANGRWVDAYSAGSAREAGEIRSRAFELAV
jgi:hypothetical protein